MADFDSGVLPSSSTTPVMDVFGNVESISNSKAHPAHHTREQPAVDDTPPSSTFFTHSQPVRPLSSRAGSRRTQSVDVMSRVVPRQPTVPSPLGPARRKRGERDVGHERSREKDTLRAELDASASAVTPGLALGTSDVYHQLISALPSVSSRAPRIPIFFSPHDVSVLPVPHFEPTHCFSPALILIHYYTQIPESHPTF